MSSKHDSGQQFYAAAYIVAWLFLSKIIFFDLIVAVLVENFEVGDTIKLINEPGRISTFRNLLKNSYRLLALHSNSRNRKSKNLMNNDAQIQRRMSLPEVSDFDYSSPSGTHYQMLLLAMTKTKSNLDTVEEAADSIEFQPQERSLFVFGHRNWIRSMCVKIMESNVFQTVIYTSIFVSCLVLVVTPPAEDAPNLSSPFPKSLRALINKSLTGVFAFEFLVTIIAQVPTSKMQRMYGESI